jgi:hypothetical protein
MSNYMFRVNKVDTIESIRQANVTIHDVAWLVHALSCHSSEAEDIIQQYVDELHEDKIFFQAALDRGHRKRMALF